MFQRMYKSFSNKSIGTKLVSSIYFFLLVSFLILSVLLLSLAENSSRKNLLKQNDAALANVILMVESKQQYIRGVADFLAASEEIQAVVAVSNMGLSTKFKLSDVKIVGATPPILSAFVYNMNGEPITYFSIDTSDSPVTQADNPVFREIITGRATYGWQFIERNSGLFLENDYSPKLCLWRVVKSSSWRAIGAVVVTIDSRTLLGFGDASQSYLQQTVLMNGAGEQLYSPYHLTAEDRQRMIEQVSGEMQGSFVADLSCGAFRVSYQWDERRELVYFLLSDYTHFTWNLEAFNIYAVFGFGLYLIFILPFLNMISKMIIKPLGLLTESIQHFAAGDYRAQVNFKHNDEIGKLGYVFNAMVHENQRLRRAEYELTLKTQNAELALLQEQINPHFLYNMLNFIQWQALRDGNESLADTAHSMAQVFRISLSRGKGNIFVRQEKELLSHYLALQQMRFGKRFHYSLDFAVDTLDVEIPKLILQPLVENAVVHGLESVTYDFTVTVEGRRIIDAVTGVRSLRFDIRDNGAGIAPEILQYLPDKVIPEGVSGRPSKSRNGSRFAIKNTYDRFAMIYGDDFTFTFTCNNGTHITIIVPTIPKKGPSFLEQEGDYADNHIGG